MLSRLRMQKWSVILEPYLTGLCGLYLSSWEFMRLGDSCRTKMPGWPATDLDGAERVRPMPGRQQMPAERGLFLRG